MWQSMLIQHMLRNPWLSEAFCRSRNAPLAVIEQLGPATNRTSIGRDELVKIAQTKIAGAGGTERIKTLIEENTEAEIRQASAQAFATISPEEAVRILTTLKGVGVPVASAVLAWCFPKRWAVIDRRSWNALASYGLLPSVRESQTTEEKIRDYGKYMEEVWRICDATGWQPQRVDRWLYAFDKCEVTPANL